MSSYIQKRAWDPRITVATVIPEQEPKEPKGSYHNNDDSQLGPNTKRYLFVEEQIDNDIITNQPAGHLEPFESLLDAAIRETLEETGWHVELTHFMGVYIYRPEDKVIESENGTVTNRGSTNFRFCFSAKPVSQISSVELDHGIIRPLWLSLEELNSQDRKLSSPMVKQCIIDYQGGRRYPLSAITEWID